MEIITVQKRLEEAYGQIDQVTKHYHRAKTNFETLDKHTKTILASEATKVEGSESERNRRALASDTYAIHEKATQEARKEYNRCNALLKGLELKVEVLRSLNKHLT
jgi:hypothetical protein